ncbi:MAG TPA: MFS transporter [Xanthobacteraceae bacterium]|nr:MFS transporter [Xanthobacteraceae bacterium]
MTRSYGWVIVAIGALMTCVSAGAMFSLAVFLDPLAHATGWSRAAISTAMTVNFLAMGLGGFFWGAASDRVGPRVVTIIGAVLLGIGLVVASQATSLLVFQLAYGLFVGFASAAFFAPLMSAATAWFVENRSLAVSLVSAGIGVAPMTVSPFARWLISAYDWRFAMLVIGLAVWVLLIPAALFLRRAPASLSESPAGAAPEDGAGLTAAQALRSPQFIILALTFFLCCSAHAGPIFHMVSYAIVCGVPAMAAVSIYSVEGLAGLGGRVLFGVLADRLGVKRVLAAGLLLQAVAIGSYVFVTRLTEFYTMAVIFGAAYGGVMPLYAALAREYFGQRIMGTVLGAATMLSSLGMAVGPLAGGAVFDAYNSYAWLFIGSFGVGLGAAAIALAFPPLPQRAAARLQPA